MGLKIVFAFLFVAGSACPSWAWGRAGFRAGAVVVVGTSPLWWPYDPYYYYPPYPYAYEYPYSYPPPYYPGYTPSASPETSQSVPEDARYDLKTIENQIAAARNEVNYEYSDGDISKKQRHEANENINAIEKQAQAEAAAGGGYLTAKQQNALLQALRTGQPPIAVSAVPERNQPAVSGLSGPNLKVVTTELSHLRGLLDEKLADGDITQAQHDAELNYLEQIEKITNTQAFDSGNDLAPQQKNALLMQLRRIDKSIEQNLIVN